MISKESVEKQYVCVRPVRENAFNISVDRKEGKTIVHCYGFGGAGWTCLFGAVEKAVAAFEYTHPQKETLVRIVGSGCMGLACALELSLRGYSVAGITTKDLYDNPSWKAGGLFELSGIRPSPAREQEAVELMIRSFISYRDALKNIHSYFAADNIRYLPVYFLKDAGKGFIPLEQMGLIPQREEISLGFGSIVYEGYARTYTYFIDTAHAMRHLLTQIEKRNIPIEIKEVHSFSELSEPVIFNCAGLGSAQLNEDPFLLPVYGHLMALNAQSGSGHMDYMLGTTVEQNGHQAMIYLFPKSLYVDSTMPQGIRISGVLGGTFLPADRPFNNEEEFDKLVERAALFFSSPR